MQRKKQGFTLIELMITIAILAIIATMAAPSFGNLIQKQNLNRSTQELIGQLNNARSKAVLERRDVTVQLNSLAADTPTQLNWASQDKTILKSGSPTKITFLLSGGVKNFAADINGKPFIICNESGGNKSKNISISLMGTIHVTEGTC
ncbi:pilus assembly FimT family protein [Acinetobacter terrestris]|uniref:Type II secretion system protein H n=1 Tax=Acinetobacter terrestris TaxID=2529843 RepID=A0ABX1UZ22_9GAMM|nr:prepilin-type N-terminal cleavage/methylation domain-containing protein [Acinetobacter terrestris]NNH27652.1 prepilin-type N-terminal cleavage/methylation domain-containing protein [Acinetobacter terrestris]